MYIIEAAICLFISSLAAVPPAPPSAGIIERQLEEEYEAEPLELERPVPQIEMQIPEERLRLPAGKKVCVRSVSFRGNESVPSEEIQEWIGEFLPADMTIDDIYRLCAVIEKKYAERGFFLARAYPPPQEVAGCKLTLEVLEGKLGKVSVIGNSYYSTPFILGYFDDLQNKPLHYGTFVYRLMLLNENSDLIAGALLEKGTRVGCVDLVLRVDDKRPVHLYLNGNNYGRFLTTNARVGGRLDYGSLIAYGDKLSVAEVVGFPLNALYFTDATYTLLLNRKGASMELAWLYSRFKIEEFTNFRLKGATQIATLKFNQAAMRTKSLNIDAFTYFDYKQIQNFSLGSRVSFDKLRVLTVGALIDHMSQGFARDYLTVELAGGIPNFLGGLKAIDNECSRQGAGGRFFILTGDYTRMQQVWSDCMLVLHGSVQITPNILPLSEAFYLGGADTVRGYPLAVVLGDNGYVVNAEFRFPPPGIADKRVFKLQKTWREILQFDLFLDQGGAFLRSEENVFLTGVGAGVRVMGPGSLSFSFDAGFPLSHRDLSNSAFFYIKLTGQPF